MNNNMNDERTAELREADEVIARREKIMAMNTQIMEAIEAMGPGAAEDVALGIIVIYVAIVAALVYAAVRYLMKGIGYGAMYRKAGVAPWKAFIPFYNTYNNYKLSWNGKMFFLAAALYILLSILGGAEALAIQLAVIAAGIALMVVTVKQNIKMAKLFGKGTGTGIALIFFPGITSLILGLGKAEFQK